MTRVKRVRLYVRMVYLAQSFSVVQFSGVADEDLSRAKFAHFAAQTCSLGVKESVSLRCINDYAIIFEEELKFDIIIFGLLDINSSVFVTSERRSLPVEDLIVRKVIICLADSPPLIP